MDGGAARYLGQALLTNLNGFMRTESTSEEYGLHLTDRKD
jgi:hypothetical protein